jgi:hypothetical protein
MTKHYRHASCNLSNIFGVLLVNSSNLQNTRHAVLIIYESYATCVPSGTRGMWFGTHLVLIYREMQLYIV